MHALWTEALLSASPSPDNPIELTWTLALGTMFVRTWEQQGSQRPEGTRVYLALHRHLFINVLLNCSTWGGEGLSRLKGWLLPHRADLHVALSQTSSGMQRKLGPM